MAGSQRSRGQAKACFSNGSDEMGEHRPPAGGGRPLLPACIRVPPGDYKGRPVRTDSKRNRFRLAGKLFALVCAGGSFSDRRNSFQSLPPEQLAIPELAGSAALRATFHHGRVPGQAPDKGDSQLDRRPFMLSDPIRVAQLMEQPRFRAGDRIVLVHGPHKVVRGTFLHLNHDVEWASIEQSDGQIRSHPVEWMNEDTGPKARLQE